MRASLLALVLAACCVAAVAAADVHYTPAAQADEITNLPGLASMPDFKMFSGYLPVDESVGRSIFYWYIESSKSPATDPLIWWSNGGPGCSGLLGLLTEHGPFRVTSDGLETYDYSWNKLANVLYVEAPAGVGYSYSDRKSDYTTDDAKTANDNFLAIQQFFLRFPHLKPNDFYIAAESYGGHYVPQLAQVIVDQNDKAPATLRLNFKGFLLGNPIADMDENTNWGQGATLCGHSLASRPTCDKFAAACLRQQGPLSSCDSLQSQVVSEAGNLDAYGLDYPTCTESIESRVMLWNLQQARMAKNPDAFNPSFRAAFATPNPAAYDPCGMDEEGVYLNRPEVRAALHVTAKSGAWEACSSKVNYNMTNLYDYMQPVYKSLLAHGGLRMVIFSGDDDSVCATSGTQHWMYDLLGDQVVQPWKAWNYDSALYGEQIGGYLVKFKGISLATVHSAGHMVSQYQPERGLAVLEQFLAGAYTDDNSADVDAKLKTHQKRPRKQLAEL